MPAATAATIASPSFNCRRDSGSISIARLPTLNCQGRRRPLVGLRNTMQSCVFRSAGACGVPRSSRYCGLPITTISWAPMRRATNDESDSLPMRTTASKPSLTTST